MKLLQKLFGLKAGKKPEHAVIVYFRYGSQDLQSMFALQKELEAAIEQAGVGDFDGNEIAVDGSDGFFYMYGPDADRLYAAVKSCLEECSFMRGATVRLRYGPPLDGVHERTIVLGA